MDRRMASWMASSSDMASPFSFTLFACGAGAAPPVPLFRPASAAASAPGSGPAPPPMPPMGGGMPIPPPNDAWSCRICACTAGSCIMRAIVCGSGMPPPPCMRCAIICASCGFRWMVSMARCIAAGSLIKRCTCCISTGFRWSSCMTLPMPAPPIIPGIPPPPMSAERSGIPGAAGGPRAAASIASNLADNARSAAVKMG
mmetsp:Transcript_16662/g.47546  ORF Transcript_16662/g.47546 Transcript_16662/m.47546 type:complete len:200 (+) Transcript_16662:48-647(+)